jgi:RNA polymerase primary sigma factor
LKSLEFEMILTRQRKTNRTSSLAPDTANTPVVKVTRTFRRKALEEAFVYFMQLSSPEARSKVEAELAVKTLAEHKIEFIPCPSFLDPSSESKILGDYLFGTGFEESEAKPSKAPTLPAHLARLCEAKLLTPDEEKTVFYRMNYLRFRAQALKTKVDVLDGWNTRRIECLLKAADWYRDWIVKSNMRLVISIVKKFVNPQNGFDDLLSDGIVALIRAVDKFDVGLGFRFSTYATQVVRRNTYRSVMEKQTDRQRNFGSIHENGIDISDDQKESSMSEQRWHELRSRLSLMLNQLDRREKFIIRARFSLGGHRRIQTLQRLADKLGVSKERIRQLEKRALDKLRGMSEVVTLPEVEM